MGSWNMEKTGKFIMNERAWMACAKEDHFTREKWKCTEGQEDSYFIFTFSLMYILGKIYSLSGTNP